MLCFFVFFTLKWKGLRLNAYKNSGKSVAEKSGPV